jgi:hypothetical protein
MREQLPERVPGARPRHAIQARLVGRRKARGRAAIEMHETAALLDVGELLLSIEYGTSKTGACARGFRDG